MNTYNFSPIGYIHSCFKEKFGIPRQPGIVTEARAELILEKSFSKDCIRDLDGFSHLWVHFIFHANQQQTWKELVRPPRLGGDKKVGVFASRSTYRPNPLGLSVVKLERISTQDSHVILHLKACDILDGTPILDIKPYLPYVDAIPDASGGFANTKPEMQFRVTFSEKAKQQCQQASKRNDQNVGVLIIQILALDPRPSYQQGEISDRIYAMKLLDFDLKWQYCENSLIKVLSLVG